MNTKEKFVEFLKTICPGLKSVEVSVESKDTSSQMIFTTHNMELLDLDMVRRDQILFTELSDAERMGEVREKKLLARIKNIDFEEVQERFDAVKSQLDLIGVEVEGQDSYKSVIDSLTARRNAIAHSSDCDDRGHKQDISEALVRDYLDKLIDFQKSIQAAVVNKGK